MRIIRLINWRGGLLRSFLLLWAALFILTLFSGWSAFLVFGIVAPAVTLLAIHLTLLLFDNTRFKMPGFDATYVAIILSAIPGSNILLKAPDWGLETATAVAEYSLWASLFWFTLWFFWQIAPIIWAAIRSVLLFLLKPLIWVLEGFKRY